MKFDSKVMVEAYIPGREVTVGIVDGDVLPIVEVVTPGDWYSYDAKYVSGGTEYLVPAPLDPACAERCAVAASVAYRAIGCAGMARIDFRVDGDQIYCLEVNTIPGFTASSLLPKAAAHAGIGFSELCDRIMCTAAV